MAARGRWGVGARRSRPAVTAGAADLGAATASGAAAHSPSWQPRASSHHWCGAATQQAIARVQQQRNATQQIACGSAVAAQVRRRLSNS